MNRKEFLRNLGAAGAVAVIPGGDAILNKLKDASCPTACVLIPTETAGPFPLDLTENTAFFRSDIRENQTGVTFKLKIRIIGQSNCLPIPNVRVNIWHCNKDGLYSGYSSSNNQGQAGLTYLRGYQFTDANGEVEFTTIFPGWYTGRICHIHFQAHVSSSYAAISQMTWDRTIKNTLYAENSSLYTKGADPLTVGTDNIFSDGASLQTATLVKNSDGTYSSFLEASIQGSGTSSLGHIEYQNAKQFTLGQNYPNPYNTETTIPLVLKFDSEVKMELWDTSGKLITTILDSHLSEGDHKIDINFQSLGLPPQNYVFQLTVKNPNGIFKDHKMMTYVK
ncbi:MAG TPA: hypothetical protein PKD51_12555 [Saprospiraceae bacterium]|nr:hypothetical protein [Saprospiraceae bacterium]HMU02801.1 hypothetical protein [Saprospiraceae bacterium]